MTGDRQGVGFRVVLADLQDCTRDEFFGNPDQRSPRAKDFLAKILQH